MPKSLPFACVLAFSLCVSFVELSFHQRDGQSVFSAFRGCCFFSLSIVVPNQMLYYRSTLFTAQLVFFLLLSHSKKSALHCVLQEGCMPEMRRTRERNTDCNMHYGSEPVTSFWKCSCVPDCFLFHLMRIKMNHLFRRLKQYIITTFMKAWLEFATAELTVPENSLQII